MTTAQNILLVYGVVILTYAFGLGIPLASVRQANPQASRHLVTTHLSGIMQGGVHLGLAFALGAADLGSGLATTAAALLVVGSALETLGGTMNWLQGTGDQFAEKSVGLRFNSLSSPPILIGMVIIAVGVIRGL